MEQDAILWNIARDESRPAKDRGHALVQLGDRENPDVYPYVLNQLKREDLKKDWLHQLLFIAEHIPWEETSERATASVVLLHVSRNLFSEFRKQAPDTQQPSKVSQDEVAIWTALRTYGRLIAPGDEAALNHLSDFTEPQWIKMCQTSMTCPRGWYQSLC